MEPTNLSLLEWISQPWHWAVSGAAIALIVFLLTWMGRSFGLSLIFKNTCSLLGAERFGDYFKMDWSNDGWRVVFVAGSVVGGFIAARFLASPEAVAISQATIDHLAEWGFSYPGSDAQGRGYLLTDVFDFSSVKGVVLLLLGGFLVGFGSRYAGGCTSGHAITGLSHLQFSSLLTVIGFFIGGLLMTHFLLPLIFG